MSMLTWIDETSSKEHLWSPKSVVFFFNFFFNFYKQFEPWSVQPVFEFRSSTIFLLSSRPFHSLLYIYIYIYWWIEGHWLAIMVDQPWRTYKSINDQEWPQCKSRTTLQFVLNNIYFIVMAIFRIGLYSLTSQNIVISIL